MDDFVRSQLEGCGCESYVDAFKENEIDESGFRQLTLDDIRQMLPNKIGPQRKIFGCIERLRAAPINANSFENVPAGGGGASVSHGLSKVQVPAHDLSIQEQDPAVVAVSPPSTSVGSGSTYVSPHGRDGAAATAASLPANKGGKASAAATGLHNNVNSIFTKYGFKLEMPIFQSKSQSVGQDGRSSVRGQSQRQANVAGRGAKSHSYQSGAAKNQFNRRGSVPQNIQKRQLKLPVSHEKENFLKVLEANQIVIVVGETGSGKSTQIPQFLLSAGYHQKGKIGITQPRRIATQALATRVAEELGANLGDLVGYRHRFENVTSPTTAITYMTDGILLQELALQPKVDNYSCIMIDEAHERALNTDILLGLLKSAVKRRKDLKLIITSATLDVSKFQTYLHNAEVFKIVGRGHDITTIHESSTCPDYTVEAVRKVIDIHRYAPPGDILVFLCGQDKIELCVDKIQDKDERRELWVLPCYSSLSPEDLKLVFEPKPVEYSRKVIVATNVAETSITIDGIVYVVDSGKSKVSYYDAKTGLKTIKLDWISKAQAKQRAGRAGRTQAGTVYRMYSECIYSQMQDDPTPEIQRSDLLQSLLLLATHGVEDLYNFDFIDKPSQEQLQEAIQELKWLEALDQHNRLTDLGRKLGRLPLDPRLAKTLLVATELGCVEDAITVVAMLQVQSGMKIYFRPKKHQYLADCKKAELRKSEGDFHTFINVYRTWEARGYSREWCKEYFINYKALNEVYGVCEQLREILETNKDFQSMKYSGLPDPEGVQKALIAGFFCRVAHRQNSMGRALFGYRRTLAGNKDLAYIHPSSALQKDAPSWVLFDELLKTADKAYMMNLVEIKPAWIHEHAPGFSNEFNMRFPISDAPLDLDLDSFMKSIDMQSLREMMAAFK